MMSFAQVLMGQILLTGSRSDGEKGRTPNKSVDHYGSPAADGG